MPLCMMPRSRGADLLWSETMATEQVGRQVSLRRGEAYTVPNNVRHEAMVKCSRSQLQGDLICNFPSELCLFFFPLFLRYNLLFTLKWPKIKLAKTLLTRACVFPCHLTLFSLRLNGHGE